MKIIKNALSEDLFSRCKKEVNQKLSKNEWSSSVIIWEPGLRQGISGSTIAAMTSEEIHNDIVTGIWKRAAARLATQLESSLG